MHIQLGLDTVNRKDVQLAHDTLGYMLGFLPINAEARGAALAGAASLQAAAATPAAQPAANSLAVDAPKEEAAKSVKVTKKKAVEVAPMGISPITPALPPTHLPPGQTASNAAFLAVKAKLQAYSEDPRYGMEGPNGVRAILRRYGVERVTALAENRYEEFSKEIDQALAAQTDPLA